MHDCAQIRSRISCILAVPCMLRRRISGCLFQDVFVHPEKRFRPGKIRRRYRNTLSRRRLIQTGPLKCPVSLSEQCACQFFPTGFGRLSGAARRAVNGRPSPATCEAPDSLHQQRATASGSNRTKRVLRLHDADRRNPLARQDTARLRHARHSGGLPNHIVRIGYD